MNHSLKFAFIAALVFCTRVSAEDCQGGTIQVAAMGQTDICTPATVKIQGVIADQSQARVDDVMIIHSGKATKCGILTYTNPVCVFEAGGKSWALRATEIGAEAVTFTFYPDRPAQECACDDLKKRVIAVEKRLAELWLLPIQDISGRNPNEEGRPCNATTRGQLFIHTSAQDVGSLWMCGQVWSNPVSYRWFWIRAEK